MVKRFEDADYHGSKYGHTLIAGEYRVMNIEVDQGLRRIIEPPPSIRKLVDMEPIVMYTYLCQNSDIYTALV